MERAIALVSGGLKSAVMVTAERSRYELLLLHVRTGTRASAGELDAFNSLCEAWGANRKMVVSLPHLAELSGHPLFDTKASLEDMLSREDLRDGFIPGLMPSLIDVAAICAVRAGAARILVGACEHLVASSPGQVCSVDQQREYFQACNESLAIASGGSNPPQVVTPLIDLSVGEIIKLGNRLKAPMEHTWSCLLDGENQCGRCVGCRRRALSFLQSGLPDPIHEVNAKT